MPSRPAASSGGAAIAPDRMAIGVRPEFAPRSHPQDIVHHSAHGRRTRRWRRPGSFRHIRSHAALSVPDASIFPGTIRVLCPSRIPARNRQVHRIVTAADCGSVGWTALDLVPANRYSWPTRGSMENVCRALPAPLASIRSLSNRPVNSRWRRFPPSLAWRRCRGWQPAVARDGRWRPAWPNHHRVASSCPSWWWRPPRLEQVWRTQYPGNTASPPCSEYGHPMPCRLVNDSDHVERTASRW